MYYIGCVNRSFCSCMTDCCMWTCHCWPHWHNGCHQSFKKCRHQCLTSRQSYYRRIWNSRSACKRWTSTAVESVRRRSEKY